MIEEEKKIENSVNIQLQKTEIVEVSYYYFQIELFLYNLTYHG